MGIKRHDELQVLFDQAPFAGAKMIVRLRPVHALCLRSLAASFDSFTAVTKFERLHLLSGHRVTTSHTSLSNKYTCLLRHHLSGRGFFHILGASSSSCMYK